MYYKVYQCTKDSREIIVETFGDDIGEIQKIIIDSGYIITLMIGGFMFKAIKVKKEEDK